MPNSLFKEYCDGFVAMNDNSENYFSVVQELQKESINLIKRYDYIIIDWNMFNTLFHVQ
jgi:hypothetical protein